MVHDAPAATLEPQLLVCENCHPTQIPLIDVGEEVPLCRTKGFAALLAPGVTVPKENEVGVKVMPPLIGPEPPVPDRLTNCGLPAALSVTVRWPVKAPVVMGLKVRLMLQCAPAAREAPQLLEAAKLALAAMPEIFRPAVPALVSVTVWIGLVDPAVTLPNESDVGDRLAFGAAVVEAPVPLRLTVCDPPPELSDIKSWPVKVPVVVGLKVRLMLQCAPAARDDPQPLEAANCGEAATLEILSAVPPVLVSVTV